MDQELEIELKNLVTENEFTTLLSHFSIDSSSFKSQENFYFDTKDFILKQHQCALRIRKKNGHFVFTLKEPKGEGLLETHEQLSSDTASLFINQNFNASSHLLQYIEKTYAILPTGLTCLGSLTTSRHERSYQSGLLVFDHSTYLGKQDYELEYEVNNLQTGQQIFDQLLHRFHIPKRATPNKIQRFYNVKFS